MLDEEKILQIIGSELQSSQGGTIGDSLSQNFETALSYYLGNPNGREVKGKSTVTSTDVADAIEWIMPQIMEALTQNNEVVRFDPSSADDESQSELESDFVYDILMKDNSGFLVIHQFVKDALMQKNGFVKAYYSKYDEVKKENYTGISELQLQMLLASPDVDLVQLTQNDSEEGITFDARIARSCKKGKIVVENVAPENIRVAGNHNSILLDGCRFLAHVENKTVSDLIKEGYDKSIICECAGIDLDSKSDYRFELQGESVTPLSVAFTDDSMKELTVSECYTYIDIDYDGVAEYVKIVVAGDQNPTHILDIEEIDSCPLISTTAILMSHKLYGLSIYDRLKQIQDHKTALWRNTMDNIYLQNNQRIGVLEGQVNLDDLLISRPGGVVRMKRPDSIFPIVTPQLGDAAYKMLDYLDMTRAGRVGVDANGDVNVENVGDRVGSEGIDRVMNAKEALVGLMIRVIAETGMKPICYAIRDLAIKHMDTVVHYKHKEAWVKVNPSNWNRRLRSTVRVGLGTGNRRLTLQGAQSIIALQEKIAAVPGQMFVKPQQIYNAVEFAAKQYGIDGISRFFLSPNSDEGKEFAQQQSASMKEKADFEKHIMLTQADAQVKISEAERMKANAQHEANMMKAENERLKNQIIALKESVAAAGKDEDRNLKRFEIITDRALKLTQIEAESNKELSAENSENQQGIENA